MRAKANQEYKLTVQLHIKHDTPVPAPAPQPEVDSEVEVFVGSPNSLPYLQTLRGNKVKPCTPMLMFVTNLS